MNLTHVLLPVLLVAVVSCSKNNNSSKPQLSIESTTTIVPLNGNLVVKFKFNSPSGKIGSSSQFTSIRLRLNQKPPTTVSGADTITKPLPSVPDLTTGEFEYSLPASGYLNTTSGQNDTFRFKFAVIDNVGKSSDTVITPIIVALYQ
jgi:hypothetical protein